MKKKLKLNQVSVKSFVTELDKDAKKEVNGGGTRETMYSCMAYVSCYITDCIDIQAS
ncbi:pinensin family lanthipeptide [Luteibaculum oceani]|uniref:pinensin family lanthipeptide n=1 Tax=Luteibaculum oceani TaxID=1294296 RepID=UPI001476B838|nr:pinensin family lanthipeptide [Luteibaculum oceani]